MALTHFLRSHFLVLTISVLLTIPSLNEQPAYADDPLAGTVADGKPWEMYVVKRRAYNILVLFPDGRGTISDGANSINPTWRAVPDDICITAREGDPERCLHLKRTKADIVASQNGKTIWILKR